MGWFVVRRLAAHRLLVAAAALTALVTTCVLAALTGFASSVGDAGLRRALGRGDAAATPLMVSANIGYPERAAADRRVREEARRAFDGLPVTVRSVASSGPYELPVPPHTPADDVPDTTFAALDVGRARLLRGGWPGAAEPGRPVPVAVPQAAERALGTAGRPVEPGARLVLGGRLDHRKVEVVVTGVYRARDVGDPYWQLDPLGGKGARTLASTSYGPLLVPDADFSGGALSQYAVAWQAVADFGTLTAGRSGALAASVQRSVDALGGHGGFSAHSELPAVLQQLRRSVLVAHSTLLVGLVELAALAAATLLVTARVLVERREGEYALLRARGAGPARLAALAVAEALLLALPAAALAPLLAGPLVGLLASHGVMAGADVRISGAVGAGVWWVSLGAAGGCALMVLAPSLRRASGDRRTGRRSGRRAVPALLRGGADLAVVGLAAAACWQLDHYATAADGSGVLTADAGGVLGPDPVLVAAPTLALCAGAAVAVRLLPPAARLAERAAARSPGLPAALAGWRLSRRSLQGAGPVLLLALATATGTLAIGQSAGWTRSQTDQAAFATGGEIRVVPAGVPAFGQGGELTAVPGVAAAVPVVREAGPRDDGLQETLLALDTRAERRSLPLRSDLSDQPVAALLAPLADPPAPQGAGGLPLPGRPRTLSLDVAVDFRATAAGGRGGTSPSDATASLAVTLTDRYGIGHPLPARAVPVDGRVHTVTVDLAALAGGTAGEPAYPLTLAALELDPPYAVGGPAEQALAIRAVRADGRASAVPEGLRWKAVFVANAFQSGAGTGFTLGSVRQPATTGAAPLTLRYDGGLFRPEGSDSGGDGPLGPTIRVVPAAMAGLPPLPAVATRAFLDSTGGAVGSVVERRVSGTTLRLRITAAVEALPGTGAAAAPVDGPDPGGDDGERAEAPRDGGALLVDIAALQRRLIAEGAEPVHPSEWWLTPAPGKGTAAAVAADLRDRPDVQTAQVRGEVAAQLLADPLGLGPQAALAAVTLAAALLAAVGFAVGAAGMLRRRADEDVALAALGASRRELSRAAAVELLAPALVGIGVGLALGSVLTRLVVPLLVLTAQATRPLPPVLVDLPDRRLMLLAAAVAAVPLLVAVAAGRRGGDLARRLRRPEEP